MGTWDFTYDTLNRLVTADSAADAPAPFANNYGCWTYDAFGNRTAESVSGTNCGSNPPRASFASYAPGSNQFSTTSQSLSGVPYDASGNVLADDAHWYLYDGEGRLCAVASVPMPGITAMTGYLYDAAGRRVAKGSIASWSCDPSTNGFQSTNDYILGQSGEQITEMGMNAAGMTWQHTNVWANGKLLATYDLDGVHFHLTDPLGTRRAQTDYAGVSEQTCSNLPFGDALACTGSSIYPTEQHFTGKERDAESGNDYFGARYYASSMGRFMSPDWSSNPQAIPYADFTHPQTLNRYQYMQNNPLSGADKDGHCDPLCGWLVEAVSTRVGTYLAQHPDVAKAVEKLGDSMGLKVSAGVGVKPINLGGVKLGAAASVSTETRVDGTGSSKLQGTVAASVSGVGVQGNGTATFEKNGSLVNPLDNLGGNVKLTGSTPHGDNLSNSNAAIGTDDRVAVGVGVNVGIAQAGVQVTAGTQEAEGVASSVGNAAIQDTKQFATDLKESTTCVPGGGCAH